VDRIGVRRPALVVVLVAVFVVALGETAGAVIAHDPARPGPCLAQHDMSPGAAAQRPILGDRANLHVRESA
jgi:hypothetical protein